MRGVTVASDRETAAFLDWLDRWIETLPRARLVDVAPSPDRAAVCSADMVVGFCQEGTLASERVGSLVTPVVEFFRRAHRHGIRDFLLAQDTHHPDTPEFRSFPVHCLEGTRESETVSELRRLPFSDLFQVVPKNSLSPALATPLERWLADHPSLETFIIVGDCTDLCTYQMAMYFRLRANALDAASHRVIVPADCVETYDLPFETALQLGAFPHPGDLMHRLFLYHLALNGCQVVASLD